MNDDERLAQLEKENIELRRENKRLKKKPTKSLTTHDQVDLPPPDVRPPSPILTTGSPKPSGKGMLQTHNLPPPPSVEEQTAKILMRVGKGKLKGEKKDETQNPKNT